MFPMPPPAARADAPAGSPAPRRDGASFPRRIVRPPLRRREAYRRSFGRTHPAGRCGQLAGIRKHVGLAPRVGHQQLDLFVKGSGLDWPPASKQIHQPSAKVILALRRRRITPWARADIAANLVPRECRGRVMAERCATRCAERAIASRGSGDKSHNASGIV
jgi:hypothetical protein